MTSNSKARNYTEFGASVSNSLTGANWSAADLARALNVTGSQVSHLMTGLRKPAPQWVDLIADTLNMSEDQRKELHRTAARQYGFKL